MKNSKENVIVQIQDSISSIFSKEDVINLINSIEDKNRVTVLDIQRAIDKTIDWVERNEEEFLDLKSAELEMDYQNRVSVVGVPLNTHSLREALENNFGDFGVEEEEEEVSSSEYVPVAENEL